MTKYFWFYAHRQFTGVVIFGYLSMTDTPGLTGTKLVCLFLGYNSQFFLGGSKHSLVCQNTTTF